MCKGTEVTVLSDAFASIPRDLVYAASFCEDGNLLSQWRGYNADLSIGFDAASIASSNNLKQIAMFKPVIYDRMVQINLCNDLVAHFSTIHQEHLSEYYDALVYDEVQHDNSIEEKYKGEND